MGVSTDAKLIYGVLVPDDSEHSEQCALFMDEKYDELQRLEKKWGVTIECHCSDACTMYIVGIEASRLVARRGDPKEVPVAQLARANELAWVKKIAGFLEEAKLDVLDVPRWWLASWWG